jgi:tetratricopeptide (TPR) repeat protein
MYNRALAGFEKAWGPEHTSTLDTVSDLGNLYKDQGRLEDAERMFNRALAGKEKALGPEHTSTLRTVHNLGLLYAKQGRPEDAERMNHWLRGEKHESYVAEWLTPNGPVFLAPRHVIQYIRTTRPHLDL